MRRTVITACIVCALAVVGGCGVARAAAAPTCASLPAGADRASCEVHARARAAARAEVERRIGAVAGVGATAGAGAGDAAATTVEHAAQPGTLTAAWQRARRLAAHPGVVDWVKPRPLAAVVGAVWFLLVARRRLRRRRRARR